MKKTISIIGLLLFFCVPLPSLAGTVLIKNNCDHLIYYAIANNYYWGIFSTITDGYLDPGKEFPFRAGDPSYCAVLVKLGYSRQFYYETRNPKPYWVSTNYVSTEHCPISGCLWMQCGSATYSFDHGPEYEKEGIKYKDCILTITP